MIEPGTLEFIGDNDVRWGGRTLTYFSGCDYFRLARHPRVAAAAQTALKKNGLNVAASRLSSVLDAMAQDASPNLVVPNADA